LRAWLRAPFTWILLIAGIGAVCRLLLADAIYPMTGDPVYSYAYRALLIAQGDWSGVMLMWHPPGLPLLLAGLTWAAGGLVTPYWWGVVLGAASGAALVLMVDALVAPRVRWPLTRLVAASFVALYEGMLVIGAAPLSESAYLPAVTGAILLLDRDRGAQRGPLLAGAIVGVAATMRLEGFAVAAGLTLYLLARGRGSGAQWRPPFWFVAGFLSVAAWLMFSDEYLTLMLSAPGGALTVPAATSFSGQIVRAAEAMYVASVRWLPYTILLPYWFFVAWGMLPTRSPESRRLTSLLLAALLPNLIVVTLTVMHKRTGSFLLPAVAIWTAFGAERVVQTLGAAERNWWRRAFLIAVISLNVGQALRVPFRLRATEEPSVTYVQGSSIAAAGLRPGCIWAFGGEPEVYYFAGFAIRYPYRDRDRGYNSLYWDHLGDPLAFVQALREASFAYLTFRLPGTMPTDSNAGAPQPYERYSGRPRWHDLERLVTDPPAYGLEQISLADQEGQSDVYLYRLSDVRAASVGPQAGQGPVACGEGGARP